MTPDEFISGLNPDQLAAFTAIRDSLVQANADQNTELGAKLTDATTQLTTLQTTTQSLIAQANTVLSSDATDTDKVAGCITILTQAGLTQKQRDLAAAQAALADAQARVAALQE